MSGNLDETNKGQLCLLLLIRHWGRIEFMNVWALFQTQQLRHLIYLFRNSVSDRKWLGLFPFLLEFRDRCGVCISLRPLGEVQRIFKPAFRHCFSVYCMKLSREISAKSIRIIYCFVRNYKKTPRKLVLEMFVFLLNENKWDLLFYNLEFHTIWNCYVSVYTRGLRKKKNLWKLIAK